MLPIRLSAMISRLPFQIAILSFFFATPLATCEETTPKTFLYDGEHLAKIREGNLKNDPVIATALDVLRKQANRALKHKPHSVVNQGELAASGDAHDYTSYATYWWPNPDTEDGLPFIRRDGVTNKKQTLQGDSSAMGSMSDDVTRLALAGYLFDEPKYSDHAIQMLRTWFLDPKTRMNPHLQYAQLIRGKNSGRYIGIIDSRCLVWICEALKVLEQYEGWTKQDQEGMQAWVAAYLKWLREDPFGKAEGATKNNHGTFYDFQVAGFALFVGDHATAKKVLEEAKTKRIAAQIAPDGTQPHELSRTKSLSYSLFNLRALCDLARLGEHVDVDLWRYESESGGSIPKAYEALQPYLQNPNSWPHEQIGPIKGPMSKELVGTCLSIAKAFKKPDYLPPTKAIQGEGALGYLFYGIE